MKKIFDLLIKGTDIKIVENKICKYCNDEFPLYDLEKNLLDKHGFCYPDFCPTCRFRMLYSYINDKHLYHRIDDLSGKNIISNITPEFDSQVYKAEDYKKMILDDYGLKFAKDIGEDIFSDFKKIYINFPKPSKLIYPELENSEYSSHAGRSKNIYMSFCVFVECENIYNSFAILFNCKNIFSSYNVSYSSNIYYSGIIKESYDISFSHNIFGCRELIFCRNMQGSQDCIFCCNQVNSKYKIFNKKYSKEDYIKIKTHILKNFSNNIGFQILERKFESFLKENLINPSLQIINSEKINGERVQNSKNSINIHSSYNSIEDSLNVMESGGGKYLLNSVESGLRENIIGSCSTGDSSQIYFCFASVAKCKNIYYCIDSEFCEECMFCIGLKNKKYCILNKNYEKEEYFKLKEKIIGKLKNNGEWGKFLGFDISN
ncbi:MAG: hypothetical protein PHE25_06420, partial [Candidatus Gracilibacteria bacterium]|nr:hypothetical protein [Candidatus Gracilibacteria bacterium]